MYKPWSVHLQLLCSGASALAALHWGLGDDPVLEVLDSGISLDVGNSPLPDLSFWTEARQGEQASAL